MLAFHRRRGGARAVRPRELTRMGGPRGIDELLVELGRTSERGYSIDDEAVRAGVYCFQVRRCSIPPRAGEGGIGVPEQTDARRRCRRRAPRHRVAAAHADAAVSAVAARGDAGLNHGRRHTILETRDLTKEFKGFVAVNQST